MLVQMSKATGETWKKGLARAEEFRESRRAFEMVTRRLATATLNTYWDYEYPKGIDPANPLDRSADRLYAAIRVALPDPSDGECCDARRAITRAIGVFFQSPAASVDIADPFWTRRVSEVGRPGAGDPAGRAAEYLGLFPGGRGYHQDACRIFSRRTRQPRYRSQLMEFREDATKLSVYKIKNTARSVNDDWFTLPIAMTDGTRPAHIIAENIISLILRPRLSANDEAVRKANPDDRAAVPVALADVRLRLQEVQQLRHDDAAGDGAAQPDQPLQPAPAGGGSGDGGAG